MELTLPLKERFEIVHDVRGLGLIWGLELGPPAGRTARRVWEAIERRQPGLFAQMVTVPLFREHHILTQVAGHHMNIDQGAAAAHHPRGRRAPLRGGARAGALRRRVGAAARIRQPGPRPRPAHALCALDPLRTTGPNGRRPARPSRSSPGRSLERAPSAHGSGAPRYRARIAADPPGRWSPRCAPPDRRPAAARRRTRRSVGYRAGEPDRP